MVFWIVRIVEKIVDNAHPILVQFAVHLRHKTKVVKLLRHNTTMFGSTMKCRDRIYFVSFDRNFANPFRSILIVPMSTHSKDPVYLLFVAHALVSDTFRRLPHALVFIFGSFPVLGVSTRLPVKLLILRCRVVVNIAI
jgi:hypothetical protein